MIFVKILTLILFVTRLQYQCEADPYKGLWPELSCHPGFHVNPEYAEKVLDQSCSSYDDDPSHPEYTIGRCDKLCILDRLGLYISAYEPPWYIENSVSYTFFASVFPDGYGQQLIDKVNSNCSDFFNQVFNEEKQRCDSPRGEEVLDCITNAFKC